MAQTTSTIEEYAARLAPEAVAPFSAIRAVIERVAPQAEGRISYGMPTWADHGTAFVHLAAWRQHVSLYPVPAMDEELHRALVPHLSGRGTLRFPLSDPLPLDRIEQVVRLLHDQRTASA